MIIKVQTSRKSESLTFWRIFSDVTGLHYGKCMQANPHLPRLIPENAERIEDDVNRFNYCSTTEAGCVIGSAPPESIHGVLLTFYEDGQPTEVFTNHECYLMNDNGRTIEQLYN